jgi:hypothetical protein
MFISFGSVNPLDGRKDAEKSGVMILAGIIPHASGWNHHALKRAVTNFKLELPDMGAREYLSVNTPLTRSTLNPLDLRT